MAEPSSTPPSSPVTPVSSPGQPPAVPAQGLPLVTRGPAAWRELKRPPPGPTHASTVARNTYEAHFAGARAALRWEDEWPLLTEQQFDLAFRAVGEIILG